jgi:hypothetical protein
MQRQSRGSDRSLAVRHAGEQRHFAVNRRLLQRNDKGKHAGRSLCVGKSNLARRTGPHVCVDADRFVGFKGTKDVAGDEIVDVPNVIWN